MGCLSFARRCSRSCKNVLYRTGFTICLAGCPLKDNGELVFYDGIRTMEQELRDVKENGFGGMMVW